MRLMAVVALVLVANGCSEQPPMDARHQGPAAGRTAHVGMIAMAPMMAGTSAAAAPAIPQPPPPTASYPSLEVVCREIATMMRRQPNDTGIVRRDTAFEYESGGTGRGCGLHLAGHTNDGTIPVDSLIAQLKRRGWSEPPGLLYEADGPGSTIYGLVSKETLCVIDGETDGGDDSDSTYVPADYYDLTVTCVPRKMNDRLP